jgi:hypothetical protein
MDFITNLPSSKAFNSIFVVFDQLIKMAPFMACNRRLQMKKLRDFLLTILISTMVFLTTSSRSFGNHYSKSLRSKSSYLLHIILKFMDKQKRLIKSWNNICVVPSITIKTIGQSCYYLSSLLITIPSGVVCAPSRPPARPDRLPALPGRLPRPPDKEIFEYIQAYSNIFEVF